MRLELPDYRTDVQVFIGNDVWTKPAAAQFIYVTCIGGGGGGGSGARGAVGLFRPGGWSGGGGAWNALTIPAAVLPDTMQVGVGAGGNGGVVVDTDDTDGVGGADGGSSSFYTNTMKACYAGGGIGGSGGLLGTNPSGQSLPTVASMIAAGRSIVLGDGDPALGCPGGGAGGGLEGTFLYTTGTSGTPNEVYAPGVGIFGNLNAMYAPAGTSSTIYGPGTSGSGGAVGVSGQNGGDYGAGAGGGGGVTNGADSGAGGRGGGGIVVVTTYF